MATVRYIVSDVEEAVAFYTQQLGFSLDQNFGPIRYGLQGGPSALARRS